MTEDEAFEELDRRIKDQKITEYIQRAQIEAARFIHDHQSELGMMTLRKAFELGFRHGYTHGTDSRTK
jgi:hypothetical protein